MGTEIERKFLVRGGAWRRQVESSALLRQGYLANTDRASIRVRITGQGIREDTGGDARAASVPGEAAFLCDVTEAWLSVKSMTPGLVRQEYEYRIPVDEAESLLRLCTGPLLEKWRHFVPVARAGEPSATRAAPHLFEIDEFLGDNAGLIVAELELDHPDEPFPRPDWLGPEVTPHERYYNFRLATYPYRNWTALERNPG